MIISVFLLILVSECLCLNIKMWGIWIFIEK